MEYVYAALILNEADEEINEDNLTDVLDAAGVDVEESRVKALVAALEDVDIEEAVSEAAAAPAAAAGGAAAGGAAAGAADDDGDDEETSDVPDTTDDDEDDEDDEAADFCRHHLRGSAVARRPAGGPRVAPVVGVGWSILLLWAAGIGGQPRGRGLLSERSVSAGRPAGRPRGRRTRGVGT